MIVFPLIFYIVNSFYKSFDKLLYKLYFFRRRSLFCRKGARPEMYEPKADSAPAEVFITGSGSKQDNSLRTIDGAQTEAGVRSSIHFGDRSDLNE